MRAAEARGEDLGLSDDELAFYDALETNDSAVKVLGDERQADPAQVRLPAGQAGEGDGDCVGAGGGVVGGVEHGLNAARDRHEGAPKYPLLLILAKATILPTPE
jgi:hypothetical protein